MKKEDPFSVSITVRGYELDAFKHVNNAVYVQYFEHCRWVALSELEAEWLGGGDLSVVVRKLSVEYEVPAHVFDELDVRLWVERVGNTSITLGQDLYRERDDQVVARAEVIIVCVDASGKPHRVPDKWRQL